MKKFITVVLVGMVVSACWMPQVHDPAITPTARPATVVHAPFTKTWNAVIDVFARNSYPIMVIDRTSGLIGTGVLSATDPGNHYADCGSVSQMGETASYPVSAVQYNVLVRTMADSSTTLQVTARWFGTQGVGVEAHPISCVSTGVYEASVETSIKTAAER